MSFKSYSTKNAYTKYTVWIFCVGSDFIVSFAAVEPELYLSIYV